MIPWLVRECTDVKELRRDVRAVVVPLIGPIEGAGVHDGDGGGSCSMMNDDLCRPNLEALALLGVCVPLTFCERPSTDDLVLSAGLSNTLLMLIKLVIII
jgi:hypothetical protein